MDESQATQPSAIPDCLVAISGELRGQIQVHTALPPLDGAELLVKVATRMIGEAKKAQSTIIVPQIRVPGVRKN